jgi:hypothetical protein
MSNKIQQLKDSNDGKLPDYAWPGGYQMFYLDKDSSVLCPDCANNNDEEIDAPIVVGDVNWEYENLLCDQCQGRIPSAYSEDD